MTSVGALLREQARAHGRRPFLWCGDERRTYAEADEVSDRLAAGLAEAGVRPGGRVAVIAPNSIELLELYFGCAKAGAVQVPMNIFLKGEFLAHQLADCQATTLVADAAGCEAALGLVDGLERVVALGEVPEAPPGVEVVGYDRLRDSAAPVPEPDLGPASLMSILYTSGTTGMPKGCMLPHGWYLQQPKAGGAIFGYTHEDVIACPLPLFHSWARSHVMVALAHGSCVVFDSAFSATVLLDRLIETRATHVSAPGAVGMMLLAQPPSERDRAHHLEHAMIMPLTAEQQARFEERFGVPVVSQVYGQTETGGVTWSTMDEERRPGSMGRPAPHLEVRLVDDHDREVAAGEVGEIVVRPRVPNTIYQGYWRQPEATVGAWRNLWHHTGDYGRADADGHLYFVDRKKDAVRRRGENVSSLQLEAALVAHPKIAEAAVHAVPSELTEDEIKACLVLDAGAELTPEELFAFAEENLPYFAVPRYVEVLDELPKTATMRVMKHRLRERGITESTWDLEALGLTVTREARR